MNALDAESAFLHDAATAHGDVRVELLLHRIGEIGLEPVEDTRRIGAVVRAVAGADAPVVHLNVDILDIAVIRGKGRANRLARCVPALLAQHRHEPRLDIRVFAIPVAFDPDPMPRAPHAHLFSADRGHIVLGVTGDNARLASGARIQVNDHLPLMVVHDSFSHSSSLLDTPRQFDAKALALTQRNMPGLARRFHADVVFDA